MGSAGRPAWFRWALGLVALGVSVLALPQGIEGPVLVEVGPGHAIALLDAVGLLPLLAGTWLLWGGVWRARARLAAPLGSRPALGAGVGFAGGLGIGLLIASSFSGFFWWWAIGAALFGAVSIGTAALAARS